jgi:subtilisin family serine protease
MTPPHRRLRRGRIPLAAISSLALISATAIGAAADPAPQATASLPSSAGTSVPGELLVGFEDGTGARARAAVAEDAGTAPVDAPPAPDVAHLRVEPGTSTKEATAALAADPAVAWVQPNRLRQPAVVPDDAWFPDQWGLQNGGQVVNGLPGTPGADADVVAAWDMVVGGPEPLVAVVDTGIAADHPDLAGSVATNPGETGGGRESNGIDDDRNGFVDDWRGWDFASGDNDPADTDGHGTLVAGTLAARVGNGVGVAGVSGGARVLPLRVVGPNGATDADIAAAFTYAGKRGARVVNASLGGPGISPVIDAAIAGAPNTLFVFPAGNSAKDNDVAPDYPCATAEPNAICLAATDQNDLPAAFSSWGVESVDLAAPGVNVLSAGLDAEGGPDYRMASGTSVAAPFAAGAAALMLRADPSLTPAELRDALLQGAEPLPQLAGTSVTGARLNVLRSLQIALGQSPQASHTPLPPADPTLAPDDEAVNRPLRSRAGARRAGAAPRVSAVRMVRWTRRVALSLRVSEGARVGATVALRRPRGIRVVRRVPARALRAGVRTLNLGRLAPGRYRVTVRAADAAANTSTAARWITLRAAAA